MTLLVPPLVTSLSLNPVITGTLYFIISNNNKSDNCFQFSNNPSLSFSLSLFSVS